MVISKKDWQRYIKKLSAINEAAANRMAAWISINPDADIMALIAKAQEISSYYGEAAAALACEMYDASAVAMGAVVPPAVPVDTPTFNETAKAVQGTMKNKDNTVPATIGRMVKQMGADTMLTNAKRDHAQFAWVPSGDTCAFCLTLASQGWQYMRQDTLKNGHAEHIHANCDCTFAIRFDEKSGVAGYNDKKYKAIYDAAPGNTSEEKIDAMRRAQYARETDRELPDDEKDLLPLIGLLGDL